MESAAMSTNLIVAIIIIVRHFAEFAIVKGSN